MMPQKNLRRKGIIRHHHLLPTETLYVNSYISDLLLFKVLYLISITQAFYYELSIKPA